MGFFKIKRKSDVLDLSKGYSKPIQKTSLEKEEIDLTKKEEGSSVVAFPFFGSSNFNSEQNTPETLESSEEKRKKLAKRLVDMTNKLEDLDNKIYHLQQRVDVLEKKEGLTGFEKSNEFSF